MVLVSRYFTEKFLLSLARPVSTCRCLCKGGTPKDSSGGVEPNRCVEDAESVLSWLSERHGGNAEVHLMGWSQGALVAQLAGQRRRPLFSKLIL